MKKITRCFLYGLLAILWAGGVFSVINSLSRENYVSMRNISMTKANLYQAQKQEAEVRDYSITLWEQQKEMNVAGKETGKTADVSVISVYGEMASVLPATFRYGHPVLSSDESGCVIDEKTAYKLFGAVDAVGTKLIWNQKEYEVKGIVKGYEGVLMIPVNDENQSYSNMEVLFDQKSKGLFPELGSTKVEAFLQRHSLPNDTMIDGEFGWQIVASLYFLPLLLLTWVACYFFVTYSVEIRIVWIRRGIAAVLFVGLCLLLGNICGYRFWIPNEWIPGKWSDFKFYTGLFEEVGKGIRSIKESELAAKDIWLEQEMFRGFLYGGILLLCSIVILLWKKHSMEAGKADSSVREVVDEMSENISNNI